MTEKMEGGGMYVLPLVYIWIGIESRVGVSLHGRLNSRWPRSLRFLGRFN